MARSTRKRLRKRLRARLLFAVRAVAVVLLSTLFVTSAEQRAAIAHALADPMALLSGRSPGERQTAALRPTKVRHEVKLPKGEKLLSDDRVVDADDLSGDSGFFAENEPAVLPAETALPKGGNGETPVADMPAFARGAGGGGYPTVRGGIIGGGGGGGSGNPGCTAEDHCGEGSTVPTGDPVPPTPIVGVPEPATWIMILIGFFTLGTIIRRARPANAAHRAASHQPSLD